MILGVIGKIYTIFLLVMLLILAYFIYNAKVYSSNSMKRKEPPQIFAVLYEFYSEIPLANNVLNFMKCSYYFLTANENKSKILATCYVSMLPGIYVIVFSIFNIFAGNWYLKLFGAIFSLLLPLYFIRNRVVNKVLVERLALIKTLGSLQSLLSTGTVDGSIRTLLMTARGSSRLVLDEFLIKYSIDKDDAFDFLETVSGDMSIKSVATYLRELDMYGKEDSSILKMYLTTGNNLCSLVYRDSKAYGSCKFVAIVILVGSVVFKFLGKSIVASLGSGTSASVNSTLNSMIFLAVALCLVSYTIGSVYSSNSL